MRMNHNQFIELAQMVAPISFDIQLAKSHVDPLIHSLFLMLWKLCSYPCTLTSLNSEGIRAADVPRLIK